MVFAKKQPSEGIKDGGLSAAVLSTDDDVLAVEVVGFVLRSFEVLEGDAV